MTCKECVYRNIYLCDKYGEIPAERIPHEINCKDFEQLADGEATLKAWLAGTPAGTIEHCYIQAMLDLMNLKPAPAFDQAVRWLYSLPDSKSVRSVRAAVFVFDVESPF